jgi:hypothetical protein
LRIDPIPPPKQTTHPWPAPAASETVQFSTFSIHGVKIRDE